MSSPHDNGGPAAKPAAAKQQVQSRSTPTPRRIHVVATATRVVSPATGNVRANVMWRCPICPGAPMHVSFARGDLPSVLERRTAHGIVLLHVAVERQVAA